MKKRTSALLFSVTFLGLAAGAVIARSAYRTAQGELAAFHPLRRRVPPPALVQVERVQWTAANNIISGWYGASRNRAAVVLMHGTGSDRGQMDGELETLSRNGFGVLSFDWPGHGESEGEVTLGQQERAAFEGAIRWLSSRQDVDPKRIGVFGNSMGAGFAVACGATDPRVAAVASTGAFTDSTEQTRYEYRHAWPWSRWAALAVGALKIEGGRFRPLDVAAQLKGRPTLFIAGQTDAVIPSQMSETLARVTGGEFWAVPNCGHTGYRDAAPGTYDARLVRFFQRALLSSQP